MRKSASEIIYDLETRIEKLEKQAVFGWMKDKYEGHKRNKRLSEKETARTARFGRRYSSKDISDDAMMWFESNARNFGRLKYTGKRMGDLVFFIPQKRAVQHNLEVVISKSSPNNVQVSFFLPGDNEELHRSYIDGNWILEDYLPPIQSHIIIEAREASRNLGLA